jgi:VTC domain-containing protein
MTPAAARPARPFICEAKFVVDGSTGRRIREWARTHLDRDPHGGGPFADEYRTTSLYFDTDAGDVFHRRGSFGRAKYRVRRYGEDEVVFLERKLRKPGMLSKRRTVVGLDRLRCLDRRRTDPRWDGDWFHRRLLLRQQKPVCQISYSRIARASSTLEGPARLTLDDDLRATTAREPQFSPEAGRLVLPRLMILELKYGHHLPAIFKRLVEELKLEPERASKYRLGMTALGEAGFPLSIPSPAGSLNVSHG